MREVMHGPDFFEHMCAVLPHASEVKVRTFLLGDPKPRSILHALLTHLALRRAQVSIGYNRFTSDAEIKRIKKTQRLFKSIKWNFEYNGHVKSFEYRLGNLSHVWTGSQNLSNPTFGNLMVQLSATQRQDFNYLFLQPSLSLITNATGIKPGKKRNARTPSRA